MLPSVCVCVPQRGVPCTHTGDLSHPGATQRARRGSLGRQAPGRCLAPAAPRPSSPGIPAASSSPQGGAGGRTSTKALVAPGIRGVPPLRWHHHLSGMGDTGWALLGMWERRGLSLAPHFGGRWCGPAVPARITKHRCSSSDAEPLQLRGFPCPQHHPGAPGGSCPGRAGSHLLLLRGERCPRCALARSYTEPQLLTRSLHHAWRLGVKNIWLHSNC